jgi:hypothetical protein
LVAIILAACETIHYSQISLRGYAKKWCVTAVSAMKMVDVNSDSAYELIESNTINNSAYCFQLTNIYGN